jgi:lipopolysaccharide biosynthesis regulator YciM
MLVMLILATVAVPLFIAVDREKTKRRQEIQLAENLASQKKYEEALVIWKNILQNDFAETTIKEILPKVRGAYETLQKRDALEKLEELNTLYSDLFEIIRNYAKLDQKGDDLAVSLAKKISEKVAQLP